MSVLIAVICPLLKNNRLLVFTGIKWTMFALILIIIRLVFPIEPFYAHSIYFHTVFTNIREILLYEFRIGNSNVSVYEILLMIWGIGIAIHLFVKCMVYHRIQSVVKICRQSVPEEYIHIVAGIWRICIQRNNTGILSG